MLIGGRYDASPRTLGNQDVGAIALDADGAMQVSDGGNSLTIDGTITADLSATDNAVLDQIATAVEIIDDWDETNRAAVNLIASQAAQHETDHECDYQRNFYGIRTVSQ